MSFKTPRMILKGEHLHADDNLTQTGLQYADATALHAQIGLQCAGAKLSQMISADDLYASKSYKTPRMISSIPTRPQSPEYNVYVDAMAWSASQKLKSSRLKHNNVEFPDREIPRDSSELSRGHSSRTYAVIGGIITGITGV